MSLQWKEKVSHMQYDLCRKACGRRWATEHVWGKSQRYRLSFQWSSSTNSTVAEGRNSRTICIAAQHAKRRPRWPVSSVDATPRMANIIYAEKPVGTLRWRLLLYLWKCDQTMSPLKWVSHPRLLTLAITRTFSHDVAKWFCKRLTLSYHFIVETKFQNAWGASGPRPEVKKVYKVMESKDFLHPYDVYRWVFRLGVPDSKDVWCVLAKIIVTRFSAIMEPRASAALVAMASRRSATLLRALHVPFSGRRSMWALGILQERMSHILYCTTTLAIDISLILLFSFGQGIYTSSASNKYVPFCQSMVSWHSWLG